MNESYKSLAYSQRVSDAINYDQMKDARVILNDES